MNNLVDAITQLEVMLERLSKKQPLTRSNPQAISTPKEAVAVIDRAWELVFGSNPRLVSWSLPCTSCGKEINLSRTTDYSNAERKFVVGEHVLCTPCRKIGVMHV